MQDVVCTKDFEVREDAAIYGALLIALRPFHPGEVVARFNPGALAPKSYLTVQTGPETHVEVDMLRFLNHSCDPNTVIDVRRSEVIACRDIAVGDELNFFYPSTEWDMDRPFACHCGAANCLGLIAGARHLPVSRLARYFINEHIREAIADLLR